MSDRPKLTCVTAVFNAVKAGNREALQRCARSVAQLTIPHEHLFIDGASTDGTLDVLRELASEIPSLRVISERDTGIYNALNKGLRAAEGDWFYVLGSDDYICAPAVLDALLAQPGSAEVIVAPVEYDGNPHYAFHTLADLKNTLRWIYGYCHQGMLVKTNLARELGGFDESYRLCADGDQMLKLHLRNSIFRYTYTAFANFGAGGANESARDRVINETVQILQKHFGFSDVESQILKRLWLVPARIARRYLFSRDLALRISARAIMLEWAKSATDRIQSIISGALRGASCVYNALDLLVSAQAGFVNSVEPTRLWSKIVWMDCQRGSLLLSLPPQLRRRALKMVLRVRILRDGDLKDQAVTVRVNGVICPHRECRSLIRRCDSRLSFNVPADVNRQKDGFLLELELKHAPVSLALNHPRSVDQRTLAMFVRDLAIFKS